MHKKRISAILEERFFVEFIDFDSISPSYSFRHTESNYYTRLDNPLHGTVT
jgi:hypothetical protein